jgi:MarR family transcriptional regulator, organic hydroperoxide resistance regulator
MIDQINEYFTDIYFHLHPEQQEPISHQGVRILQMVDKRESVMIRDIALLLTISHNTASEHVKKLTAGGWLYKERDERDQRKVYLHLTESGKTMLKKNTELDGEKLSAAFEKLSAEERQQIFTAFKLLSEASK